MLEHETDIRSNQRKSRVDEGRRWRGEGGTPTTVQGLADGGCPKQPLSSKHPLGEPSPPRYDIIESEKKRLLIDTTVSSDPESTTEVGTVRAETKKDERGTEVKPTAV
jgi:hypothetical protein